MSERDSGAIIDSTQQYRYSLWRQWGDTEPVTFIMLNPSTADESKDDPTIRRCIGFANTWGYGGILIANLFAYRATNPKVLTQCVDPVGPHNHDYVFSAIQKPLVIAAWGCSPVPMHSDIRAVLSTANLRCLGVTKFGHPRHPLYVAGATKLLPYEVNPS